LKIKILILNIFFITKYVILNYIVNAPTSIVFIVSVRIFPKFFPNVINLLSSALECAFEDA